MSDVFSSPYEMFSGDSSPGGVPSINGIKADFTSARNILSGDAKSADYGRGIGAAVGAYFGAPQEGADIGAKVLPFLNKEVKPALVDAWHGIWDAISK